jgi:hypothetical protein
LLPQGVEKRLKIKVHATYFGFIVETPVAVCITKADARCNHLVGHFRRSPVQDRHVNFRIQREGYAGGDKMGSRRAFEQIKPVALLLKEKGQVDIGALFGKTCGVGAKKVDGNDLCPDLRIGLKACFEEVGNRFRNFGSS